MPPNYGAVAQLGERSNRTAEVVGSIPSGSTIFRCKYLEMLINCYGLPGSQHPYQRTGKGFEIASAGQRLRPPSRFQDRLSEPQICSVAGGRLGSVPWPRAPILAVGGVAAAVGAKTLG